MLRQHVISVFNQLTTWVTGKRSLPGFNHDDLVRKKGFLPDGSSYLVYPIALYSEGFKQHKSLSDSREVGRCYILPLGLSIENRRSSPAARVLTLTPHGQSLNEAFNLLMDDLFVDSMNGFASVDPYGSKFLFFLDPVSLFEKYLAISAATDVTGHNGTSFCTFCTMSRHLNAQGGSIKY